ncbi:alkyl sulfatase dimerization domain-containing protein [Paenibacillus sp. BSR1-1]|uniref:alkyl/aryl-sulfatase n=1 Tax=Paenibacillus sp. BSR1-1 TaxID=3020845 RepID=UPI0025AF6B26|nr:alkyl sulfatase dimerization domain-containing protein [Paenibacillus sp. BSR1-1]MDN3016945.1 alkyl sulfatase dimerization domain-containing protein [Paenibacillus sp. BSR1-1]
MTLNPKNFIKKCLKAVPYVIALWLSGDLASSTYASILQKPVKPKGATEITKKVNANIKSQLNFADRQDFEDAHRGFLAPLEPVLKTDNGDLPINFSKLAAIVNTPASPSTVNPSLWRSAQLQNIGGLFMVKDGVFQIRGLDIAVMTIIEGKEGIVICDTLTTKENAKTALELYFKVRGKKPVTGIVVSHSHIDHFGGMQGVMQYAEHPTIPVVAPDGFMDEAVSENVLLGNIMARRAQYQFAQVIPIGAAGSVSQGIGPAIPESASIGSSGILKPTIVIKQDGEKQVIDGVTFSFLMAQNTEAPAEMNAYIENYKTMWVAENVNHSLHNIYALRGAKTRDAAAWSDAIDRVEKFVQTTDAEVLITSHFFPTWGKDRINELLEKQRDLYKYLHDQTIRLANEGYTMDGIAEMVTLPDSLGKFWANRGYYGTIKHNVKAIYNFYLGYYSGNPSDLDPLPQEVSGKRYVEYMGGEKKVLNRAKEDFKKGQYRWVAQVLKNVVMANPSNNEAKILLADAYEQLGYQAESAIWRNSYLVGAHELRNGIDKKFYESHRLNTSALFANMPVSDYLDFLSVKLNGMKADKKKITLTLYIIDTKEKFLLILENSVLRYEKGQVSVQPDASLTLDKATLFGIGSGAVTVDQTIAEGKLAIHGDEGKLNDLLSLMDNFDPEPNIVIP